jgi:hypothetical protein
MEFLITGEFFLIVTKDHELVVPSVYVAVTSFGNVRGETGRLRG